jgi:hypothetical protein
VSKLLLIKISLFKGRVPALLVEAINANQGLHLLDVFLVVGQGQLCIGEEGLSCIWNARDVKGSDWLSNIPVCNARLLEF